MDDKEFDEVLDDFFRKTVLELFPEDSLSKDNALFAHYTSIEGLEAMMKPDGELWFSNPLFMNDLQEMQYGMDVAQQLLSEGEGDKLKNACGEEAWENTAKPCLNYIFDDFEKNHTFDTYVFCLSEHDKDNTDGRLSMWRGYGAGGHGAAIVFDLFKLSPLDPPFLFSRVEYFSEKDREEKIKQIFSDFADLIKKGSFTDEQLKVLTYRLCLLLRLNALFTKHKGFEEEQEWRIVYLPELDFKDNINGKKKFEPLYGYALGANGVEPKLKLKLNTENDEKSLPFNGELEKMISKIILGPSKSSELTKKSVKRMLEALEKEDLAEKVISSTIPFRPT